jgi:hypothetical protein
MDDELPYRPGGRKALIEGNFKRRCSADIFAELHRKAATGCLSVATPRKRSIFFEKGQPVYARSSVPGERLGELLVRTSKLTQQQLAAAIAKTGPEQKLGTVLVDNGLIGPLELIEGLKLQVTEIVLAVFSLERGEFKFEPQYVDKDLTKLPLKLESVLSEGSTRVDSARLLLRGLGPMDSVLELKTAPVNGHRLAFKDKELLLLDSLKGHRLTLRQICQRSAMPAMSTCQMLYALRAVDAVAPGKSE